MDAEAMFEILVREHAPMLSIYLRSVVRDPAAVDDLFQETMLTAWKTLDRFDRSRPFAPWLRGIAAKLVLAWRRQRARSPQLCDEEVLAYLSVRMDQLHALSGDTLDDKLAALKTCVAALPAKYQEAIHGRYRDGLMPAELSERRGVNLETIKKRLHRARTMLLHCLSLKLPGI